MDQTNSKFGNSPGHTINQHGACTINMRTGTMTASIAIREIRDQPQEMKYTMQLKAWFNEVTMLDWVNNVDDVLDNSNGRHLQQQRNG